MLMQSVKFWAMTLLLAYAQTASPQDLGRIEDLNHDLDYFIAEAQRSHAGPGRPAYSDAFIGFAESLRARLGKLDDLELLGEFIKLMAILDDGHSAFYGVTPESPLDVSRDLLPLKFYQFEEGLFITDGIGLAREFAGYEVLRLGELGVDETLSRLSEYRGVDNEMTWVWMASQFYLPDVGLLRLIGATDSVGSIDLTLQDSTGKEVIQTFRAGETMPPRKLRPSPASRGETPLYLSRVDSHFWLRSLPESRALYFQFNQVRDSEQQSIARFAAELNDRLSLDDIENLIVDVRHNNGGNNTLLKPLVQVLIAYEQTAAEHRIFVITGRNTFSAAQNFINRVERWTDAIFVGEPSSSSPNFVGEETPITLPFSGITGSLSDLYWQDSDPWDERDWIAPDIAVEVTARDYFSGRDAALEAIVESISTGRQ